MRLTAALACDAVALAAVLAWAHVATIWPIVIASAGYEFKWVNRPTQAETYRSRNWRPLNRADTHTRPLGYCMDSHGSGTDTCILAPTDPSSILRTESMLIESHKYVRLVHPSPVKPFLHTHWPLIGSHDSVLDQLHWQTLVQPCPHVPKYF